MLQGAFHMQRLLYEQGKHEMPTMWVTSEIRRNERKMEIHIKRTKERAEKPLEGKDWKLISAITVTLSEAEEALVKKHYYYPSISLFPVDIPPNRRGFCYEGTDEIYEVEVQKKDSSLSNFELIASVFGHKHLGRMQGFEAATIQVLEDALHHLKNLDNWEGEKVIELE